MFNQHHIHSDFICFNVAIDRFVYHSSSKDYVSHQLMGSPGYKPLINITVPHAIFPYAAQVFSIKYTFIHTLYHSLYCPQLSTKVYRDCLNRAPLQCMADVLGRLPVLRTVMYWMGSISASKRSIVNALSKGYNIGLVPVAFPLSFVFALFHWSWWIQCNVIRIPSFNTLPCSGWHRGDVCGIGKWRECVVETSKRCR